MNAITLWASRHTFNNFFAQQYGRKPISAVYWAFLLLKSRLVEMSPSDFLVVKNTKARPGLLGLTAEDAYPLEERNRGDDDVISLQNFLQLIDAGEKLPRVIIGEVGDDLIMLDGDHRAIAAIIRGVDLPVRIVHIP